VIIFNKTLFL